MRETRFDFFPVSLLGAAGLQHEVKSALWWLPQSWTSSGGLATENMSNKTKKTNKKKTGLKFRSFQSWDVVSDQDDDELERRRKQQRGEGQREGVRL